MHHGPIFTLYDVCEIVLQYFRKKKWPITTMSIADAVLTEHEKNRVQVVMLCSSVHELVHNGSVFLNLDQGYGRLDLFIDKYIDVFPEYIKEKYNRYMDRSILFDSNDLCYNRNRNGISCSRTCYRSFLYRRWYRCCKCSQRSTWSNQRGFQRSW